jgi:hypothetical protein
MGRVRGGGDDVAAACAAVYGSELTALLLGGKLHPGGRELTRRLADLASVGPGDRVLDVGCGDGSTAAFLAAERDARVLGIDVSPTLVARARRAAIGAGLGDAATFEVAAAESFEVQAARFDVVFCECALSTFAWKPAVVERVRLSLARGGRVGISDVTIDHRRLPDELKTPIARVACVAGALSEAGYERLLRGGGFADVVVEPHPEAAAETIESIGRGLDAARPLVGGAFDVDEALRLVDVAAEAVRSGVLGYVLVAARVGDPPERARGRVRADVRVG